MRRRSARFAPAVFSARRYRCFGAPHRARARWDDPGPDRSWLPSGFGVAGGPRRARGACKPRQADGALAEQVAPVDSTVDEGQVTHTSIGRDVLCPRPAINKCRRTAVSYALHLRSCACEPEMTSTSGGVGKVSWPLGVFKSKELTSPPTAASANDPADSRVSSTV